MDVYLPADFHALHDEVVTDWRDAHSPAGGRDEYAARPTGPREDQHAVDPSWLAL